MIRTLTIKQGHEYYAHHDHAHEIVMIMYSICCVCL